MSCLLTVNELKEVQLHFSLCEHMGQKLRLIRDLESLLLAFGVLNPNLPVLKSCQNHALKLLAVLHFQIPDRQVISATQSVLDIQVA